MTAVATNDPNKQGGMADAALSLLMELMNGNTDSHIVRDALLHFVIHDRDGKKFLLAIRARLAAAMAAVRERQEAMTAPSHGSSSSNTTTITSGGGGTAMAPEMRTVYYEMEKTLLLLQMVVQGHFRAGQDILREQPPVGAIDLVSDVAKLFTLSCRSTAAVSSASNQSSNRAIKQRWMS